MTGKDVDMYEAELARKSIINHMEGLSNRELIELEKLVKNHKEIANVLDFFRRLK